MPRPATAFLLLALSVAACSLGKPNPRYCAKDADCPDGSRCNLNMNSCVASDAGTGGSGGGDGGSDTPGPECTSNAHCTAAGKRVCDPSVGMCVGCLGAGDCNGTTPICEAKTCRACRSDTECGTDPGVCLGDGRCATSGEVVFVEDKAAGCPSPDGTSDAPYCAPNEGVAALTAVRRVLIVRGLVSGRLVLSTTGVSPVVIGRKNAAGDDGAIPASAATAVSVSSDDVLIRDLLIRNGGASTSRGVVVSGSSTKLTLLRVNVSFMGTGLGIEANTGAELRMDRCVVENNSLGGILIDGAGFDITNTVVAANGPGMAAGGVVWGGLRITGTVPTGLTARFLNNTVINNNPIGLSCAFPQSVSGTIVFGNTSGDGAGCTITSCCTGNPMLTANYHLMAGSPCIDQLESSMSTAIDIDGQSRPNGPKSDCGADEYVP